MPLPLTQRWSEYVSSKRSQCGEKLHGWASSQCFSQSLHENYSDLLLKFNTGTVGTTIRVWDGHGPGLVCTARGLGALRLNAPLLAHTKAVLQLLAGLNQL